MIAICTQEWKMNKMLNSLHYVVSPAGIVGWEVWISKIHDRSLNSGLGKFKSGIIDGSYGHLCCPILWKDISLKPIVEGFLFDWLRILRQMIAQLLSSYFAMALTAIFRVWSTAVVGLIMDSRRSKSNVGFLAFDYWKVDAVGQGSSPCPVYLH